MFSAFYDEYNVGFWKMQIIAFCLLLQQNYSIATNWRANLEQIKVFTVLKNTSRVSSQKSNCFTIWPSRNCVQLTEHDSASGFPCSLTPSLPYTCLLLSLSYPFWPRNVIVTHLTEWNTSQWAPQLPLALCADKQWMHGFGVGIQFRNSCKCAFVCDQGRQRMYINIAEDKIKQALIYLFALA